MGTKKTEQSKVTDLIIRNIAKLIDVKTIITLALIGCLVMLAVRQNTPIPSELYAAVISSIMTYFFTKRSDSET